MNEALDLYEKEDKVTSIHGYVYPVKEELPETFFFTWCRLLGLGNLERGWVCLNQMGENCWEN